MKRTNILNGLCLVWSIVPMCLAQHPSLQPAWEAFNKPDYREAAKHADKCIDDYAFSAAKMEADLEANRVPAPPTGAVGAEQKKEILERGPLNDAAACYFIKGRSAQKLDSIKQARQAYTAGCKLKYARIWDPHGWFWSPVDEMCARLQALPPVTKAKKNSRTK